MVRGARTTQKKQGVTCIIPAVNEEKTIGKVIECVKQVPEVTEIIVVDDGSTDETAAVARKHKVKVAQHDHNLGKGAAMKTGARKARNNFLVYIDADLRNISPQIIRKLIKPLINNKADFVKASYGEVVGRVAKLTVKPLLKIVYPFVELDHPLSGEVALNKKKFRFDTIEDGWSVDIQLVLQAARRNLRITQVNLGKKDHPHQSIEALSEMSEQIIRTILSELDLIAHEYKIVFFDLDKTLITESSIEVFARAWGFEKELESLQRKVKSGEIPDKEITKALAKHFEGKTQGDIDAVCETIEIHSFADQVIEQLRQQRFRVRIVSSAFSPVVQHFANRLNVHDFVCPRISRDSKKRYTGRLKKSRFEDKKKSCCGMYVCKKKAVNYVRRRFGFKRSECMGVGDGKNDECMFSACGLALGYKTDIGDIFIKSLSEVLMYIK